MTSPIKYCQNYKYCDGILNDKGKCNVCPKGLGKIYVSSIFCDDPQCNCSYRCKECNYSSIDIHDDWSRENIERIKKIKILLAFENYKKKICISCFNIKHLCKNFIRCGGKSYNYNKLCDDCIDKNIKEYNKKHNL